MTHQKRLVYHKRHEGHEVCDKKTKRASLSADQRGWILALELSNLQRCHRYSWHKRQHMMHASAIFCTYCSDNDTGCNKYRDG